MDWYKMLVGYYKLYSAVDLLDQFGELGEQIE